MLNGFKFRKNIAKNFTALPTFVPAFESKFPILLPVYTNPLALNFFENFYNPQLYKSNDTRYSLFWDQKIFLFMLHPYFVNNKISRLITY